MKQRGTFWKNEQIVLDVRNRRRFRIGERVYVDGDLSMGRPVKDTSAIILGYDTGNDAQGRRLVRAYLRQSKRELTVSPDWFRRWH
jgi:hypothetical protein